LRIIKERHPTVFVMENVKGILSSKVGGQRIFSQILQDLSDPYKALGDSREGPKYRIHSLVLPQSFTPGNDVDAIDPRAFIVRAEEHGIPQARHRVILLGIAIEKDDQLTEPSLLKKIGQMVSVEQAIGNLPKLRSTLTKQPDSWQSWTNVVTTQLEELRSALSEDTHLRLAVEMRHVQAQLQNSPEDAGGLRVSRTADDGQTGIKTLDEWYLDNNLRYWLNHEDRGHMRSDLRRYIYASIFARVNGISPKGHEQFALPGLAASHKNWKSGKFSYRFRVQLQKHSSTTITSHISIDGHYFI